jgi:hypothetical protein
MERYRITKTDDTAQEQTWVLLPDKASAYMQAQELANREKTVRIRVYHEATGHPQTLVLDLNAG